MHIYGPAHLHGPQAINAPHNQRSAQPGATETAAPTGDQLEISNAGQIAARLSEIPDIRQDRVAQIRSAIAEGTYDNDERLSAALDRLLEEIG